MATDDYTLGKEVRTQTTLGETALSDSDLRTFIGRAQSQIEIDAGTTISDWYSDASTESALFWLTCIMVVDTAGGGDSFAVGELEFDPGDDESGVPKEWTNRYDRALSNLGGTTGTTYGIGGSNRTDRVYGDN